MSVGETPSPRLLRAWSGEWEWRAFRGGGWGETGSGASLALLGEDVIEAVARAAPLFLPVRLACSEACALTVGVRGGLRAGTHARRLRWLWPPRARRVDPVVARWPLAAALVSARCRKRLTA